MILITGATGFLGAELALQLARQGNHLRCTKRPASTIPAFLEPYSGQIDWVEADILDAGALEVAFEGITEVYHCAAWVSLKQADKEPMISANVNGTANIVNVCLTNAARLVHVSSVAAIGDARPGELINENHHLDQSLVNDGYATSKLESEMEVWRGIAEGLDAVIVNPSVIIGVNDIHGSRRLFETVRKGLKFYTSGSIGFVAVEDVAKSMITLMNTDISSERFIISAENRDYKQIVSEIAQCFGLDEPTFEAKPWMLEVAWRGARVWSMLTGGKPAIDKVAAQSAALNRDYDNSKIKAVVGMEFKKLSKSLIEICQSLTK